MYTPAWYLDVFVPMVKRAAHLGINVKACDRLVGWIMDNPQRKSDYADCIYFLRDLGSDYDETVQEALTLEV